jgi:predicted Zn-dependent protease
MKIEWMEKYLKEAEQMIYDNQVNEGLQVLTDLLYDEPGYGYLHNHLGWAYLYYTADVALAELHLKMAIKFDGEYPAPYVHLGNLFIRTGRYAEAIEYLEQGVKKPNANRVTFLEATGQAYELKGEMAKAIKSYREATLASVVNHEITNLTEHIKRCRKKQWTMMFGLL